MAMNQVTDVLVAGAGPVGLMAAISLRRRGKNVVVIDKSHGPGAHSYALAVHPRSLGLLDDAGMADEIVALGRRIDTMAVYDHENRVGAMNLSAVGGKFPFLVVLRQDMLEDVLIRRLEKENVRVQWNHALSDVTDVGDHLIASVQQWGHQSRGYAVASSERVIERTLHVKAAHVVGADGHHSTVRRLAEIPFEPAGDSELYAVFEMQADVALPDEARLVLTDGLLSVLWPMAGGRCRWSFQLPDAEAIQPRRKNALAIQIADQNYPYLSFDSLRSLLRTRAPWFAASAPEVHWSIAVRFERRLAGRFAAGRMALAGDAAHLTGPAGMQSMNVGLAEADLLATALGESQPDAHSALDAYDHKAMAPWRTLLGGAAVFKPGGRTPAAIVRRGATFLSCIPASGADLAPLATQLGLDIKSV